jgi:hypothetical protein
MVRGGSVKTRYTLAAVIAAVAFATGTALGQAIATGNGEAAPTTAPPTVLEDTARRWRGRSGDLAPGEWSFSAAAYVYVVPGDRDYVQPTFTADRKWLHLEARYNYEDLDTGSAWVGYNFSLGEKLAFQGTLMLGGVFGNTTGIAPGYKASLGYRRFALYSEGEYVFDTGDSSGSFFYSWTELTYSPVDWFRVGLVAQRTQAYKTAVDIQSGLLLGFTYKRVDLAAYVFNLGRDDPALVFSIAVGF